MIIRIGSSIPSFKTMVFRPGLNIILADKDDKSGDAESRNGCGKSSLIEIMHFLLGSTPTKDSLLRVPSLSAASFYAEMQLNGILFKVTRSVRHDRRVEVIFADGKDHGLMLDRDLMSTPQATIHDWCAWLGQQMFKLPSSDDSNYPTFRSLFGYFARRRDDGGFQDPTRFARSAQSKSAAQVALSYLLGLDWQLATEFQEQRDEKAEVASQRKRAKARIGAAGRLRSVSALRSEVALARSQAETLRSRVSNFRVHDQYQELAAEAATAKLQIEKLSRESVKVDSAIRHINISLVAEETTDGRQVANLYRAAGIQFPESALRTFEHVKIFHESVIRNRRQHLADQLAQQQRRFREIESEIAQLGARRSEILSSLAGRGAFSDLSDTTRQLALKENELARLETQLSDAVVLEKDVTEVKDHENKLLARLQYDLEAREDAIAAAVVAAEEARQALYKDDRLGLLEINAKPSGPEFKITIDGTRSGGISNMEIFCFDYALSKVTRDRLGGPGLLVHDSHLFDGVDARQVAKAIELGANLAEYINGQYLVMLNSDEFEKLQFSADFDASETVLPTILRDTEDGGLFGFRFK